MRRQDSLFIALAAATIVFALAFVAPFFFPHEVAWYLPLERRWEMTLKPKVLGMDFYGRTIEAAIAGTIAFTVALLVVRRRAVAARTIGLFAGWALVATIFVMSYFT